VVADVKQVEGFVLHSRNYTDSKKILHLFTYTFGLISAVIRESKRNQLPRPFVKCYFELSGRGGLKTIRSAESLSAPVVQEGRGLFCGIYLNELITRALPDGEGFDELVRLYDETIVKLGVAIEHKLHEVLLRRFELVLLQEMGLGMSFTHCIDGQRILPDDSCYVYGEGQGFRRVNLSPSSRPDIFTGAHLNAINVQDWNKESLLAAKHISRLALRPLLGNKPIKARELFT